MNAWRTEFAVTAPAPVVEVASMADLPALFPGISYEQFLAAARDPRAAGDLFGFPDGASPFPCFRRAGGRRVAKALPECVAAWLRTMGGTRNDLAPAPVPVVDGAA